MFQDILHRRIQLAEIFFISDLGACSENISNSEGRSQRQVLLLHCRTDSGIDVMFEGVPSAKRREVGPGVRARIGESRTR
jgi:hypothetical protein